MLKDMNSIELSGKIFWSKLDVKEKYSTLRLGLDIGVGNYSRIFATISNPHEKAHQFVKNDNQVILIGAWLDTWKKENGDKELQIKAYDSNCQFYTAEVAIPRLNNVSLYGKIDSLIDGVATIDCIGGKNPQTSQYTHRLVDVSIGNDYGDAIGKHILIKGVLSSEEVNGKQKLKVDVDYNNIHIMR